MKRYRIVEFNEGGYGIQCKNNFFSRWKLLPFEPISFLNGAAYTIGDLRKEEENEIKRRNSLKIKRVCGYY